MDATKSRLETRRHKTMEIKAHLWLFQLKKMNTIFREENHDFVVRNMSSGMRLVGLEPRPRPPGSAAGGNLAAHQASVSPSVAGCAGSSLSAC